MIVYPGFKTPDFSASSIILLAMRSLTEPPALKNSHFASLNSQSIHKLLVKHEINARTNFAFNAVVFGNFVQSNQRRVSDMIQNGRKDARRGIHLEGNVRMRIRFRMFGIPLTRSCCFISGHFSMLLSFPSFISVSKAQTWENVG